MTGAAGVGHLSIGEVLSLVQEDFPDVTISKIRFLESQGLIAPERTAAGYRKFYDSDIERLRWILRQQRDHFLPLKVIRKMLDQGVDVSPEEQPTLWSSAATGPTSGDSAPDTDEDTESAAEQVRESALGASEGHDTAIDVTDSRTGRSDESEDSERATYRSPAHPAVASARTSQPRRGSTRSPQSQDTSGTTHADPSGPSPTPGPARSGAGDTRGEGEPNPPEPDADHEAAHGPADRGPRRSAYATPADVVAALQEDPRSRRRRRGAAEGTTEETTGDAAAGAPVPEPADAPARGTGEDAEVRMTGSELCEAAGVSADLLTDLEQFGLLSPTVLGGDPQYDADALEVAKIAARYAELGVGARHLRMYKVAAEREAGFVEQLVVPLLKQRNPTAREQAVSRAEELQRMGTQLHANLLRRRLGPSLGG